MGGRFRTDGADLVDRSKRSFCRHYFTRQACDLVRGFRGGLMASKKKQAFDQYFDSYESSYALTLAYPDDILLETARKNGVETEGREKNDIIKELFLKQGGNEYRF